MKRKLFCILLSAILLFSAFAGMKLQVSAASDLKASDECIEILKAMEGFSAKPYWDYSQYSVGYGTACPSEEDRKRYEEEGISEEEAEMLLRKYVETSEEFLNAYLVDKYSVPLTQNQFDALVLFTYNCGTNWILDSTGSLHKAIVSGATGNDFLYPFSRWCIAGGKVQKYLLDRRMKEANIYLNGVYSTAVPDCFGYVLFDGNGGKAGANAQGYILDQPVAPVPTATLEGSTFSGWYTAKTDGTKVELLDASVKGKTLYAMWNLGEEKPPEVTEPEEEVPDTTVPDETVPDETVPETPAEPESVKVKVTGDYVNVRKGPGTGYGVAGGVRAGDELTITETAQGSGYNWGKFTDGWICLKYTNYDSVVKDDTTQPEPEPEKPGEPQKVTGIVQVDSTLRIRSGAGTSYPITGYLSSGTEVEILERKTVNGITWGKITKGWISMDYVKLDATKPEEETPEPETPDTKPEDMPTEPPAENQVIATGTVTADDLRIRSGAGTGTTVLGFLSKGTKVEIYEKATANGITWGRTSKGWISLDYVKLDDNSGDSDNAGDKVIATGTVINTNNLRIRSAAGTFNSVVGYLTMGTKVEIYERTTVGSMVWGRIDKGWISLDYIKLDSNTDSGTSTTKTVNTSSLRIRSAAGTNNSIVGYLTMGQKVEILEQTTVNGTVWGRISNGWISMDYVK